MTDRPWGECPIDPGHAGLLWFRPIVTKLLTFRVTRTIDAANDMVWRVLGDFGREHLWARGLAHCERDTGAVSKVVRRDRAARRLDVPY